MDDFAAMTGAGASFSRQDENQQGEEGEEGEDDEEGERGEEKEEQESSAESSPPSTPPSVRPIRQPRQRTSPHKPSFITSNLDKLSLEIRFIVYEQILTVRQPIKVHSGWQQVYKRQRLGIATAILRTCKRFYHEAISVLYGSNTFLYRLRDKIPCITDVDQVAHIDEEGAVLPTMTNDDDEPGDEDEDPEPDDVNDPDWQEDLATAARPQNGRRTRSANRPAAAVEPDIHLKQHMHLFRHLIIEAEKNRSAQGTKKLMANAIQAFAFERPTTTRRTHAPSTNIDTLTIRVAPQWDATAGPDGHGRFTFVDFFSASSVVMRAIETLNCRFLQLDLMTRYMDAPFPSSGCRLTMDMRYARLVRNVQVHGQDDWAHDPAMQQERQRKAAVALGALRTLDGHVRAFCERFLSKGTWDGEWWRVIDVGAGE